MTLAGNASTVHPVPGAFVYTGELTLKLTPKTVAAKMWGPRCQECRINWRSTSLLVSWLWTLRFNIQSYTIIQFPESALDLISEASGSIWIGGRRTQACRNSALSTSCGSLNSFQWTDGSTTGTAGLVWNTNQPDNKDSRSQQCLVLLASRASSIQDKWTWYANRMDDVQCAASGGESAARALRAYACGKRARNWFF